MMRARPSKSKFPELTQSTFGTVWDLEVFSSACDGSDADDVHWM